MSSDRVEGHDRREREGRLPTRARAGADPSLQGQTCHLLALIRVLSLLTSLASLFSVSHGAPTPISVEERPSSAEGAGGPRLSLDLMSVSAMPERTASRWVEGLRQGVAAARERLGDTDHPVDRTHQISDSRCGHDSFEPNNRRSRAKEMSVHTPATGRICGEDVDWYRFSAQRGDQIELELSSWGKGRSEIRLYPPRARRARGRRRRARRGSGNQQITHKARESGVYRVVVRGEGEAQRYTLKLSKR
ncbi:MAG: hypothetical protein VYD19_07750 [Myxococcota bacterium]|nr:hypothetical protein [Myxococcota bacterium]